MATQVIMPQMGESVIEGTVGVWLKAEGDPVAQYEPIVEVETDKVTSEITAEVGGVLLKIYVGAGQTVPAGTVLALIGPPGEAVPADAPAKVTAPEQDAADRDPVRAAPSASAAPHMTPVVARIAAEHQIDVRQITGTGRDGRVTKKDIMAYIEQGGAEQSPAATSDHPADLPAWEQPGSGDLFKPTDDLFKTDQTATDIAPAVPAAPTAPTPAPRDHVHGAPPSPGKPGDLIPHNTMRRRIAEHMVRSKLQTSPHVTTVFEADLSAIVAHRDAHQHEFVQRGVNLTFTAYFVAATAEALRRHPIVNSQWREDGIQLMPDVNIGMAVALTEGLIVPVIKRADELALTGIARQVNDLAIRARAGQLKPDEVQDSTFTITNHGVAGSLFATPIINQPHAGILGVGAIQKRVVVLDHDALAVRPMVYISFTFDHRILDGAAADWFVAEIVKLLEGWG
ncbi:MAG: 2-oxo acid dehydrogenase subunit E2 [Anaerolineae bacterium]|nr:2-oxo acid dehydrogenase subunit E2 [Anaerolineae bacterium]